MYDVKCPYLGPKREHPCSTCIVSKVQCNKKQANLPIAATSDENTLGIMLFSTFELQCPYTTFMALQCPHLLGGVCIKHFNSMIIATNDNVLVVVLQGGDQAFAESIFYDLYLSAVSPGSGDVVFSLEVFSVGKVSALTRRFQQFSAAYTRVTSAILMLHTKRLPGSLVLEQRVPQRRHGSGSGQRLWIVDKCQDVERDLYRQFFEKVDFQSRSNEVVEISQLRVVATVDNLIEQELLLLWRQLLERLLEMSQVV